MPSARIGLLLAALLALALAPASAAAVTNSVAFSGRMAMATAPTAAAAANTGFAWAHAVTTSPAGSQPDTIDTFRVAFPSPLILNAQDFPICDAASVDGKASLSADCQNAVVGSGTATMYAGSPGQPMTNSVREDLLVTAINGAPAGSALLLVLNSSPTAPVAITNRVLPGTIASEPGYAFAATFSVPADLQMQLGLSISLTDLDVTISGTPRPITVGTQTRNISYLQLPACAGQLTARQLTTFRSAPAATTLTSDAGIACERGSFPDPAGFPTAPYTSPRTPPPADEGVPAISVARAKHDLGRVRVRRNGTIALPGTSASCPAGATGPCTVTGSAAYRGRAVAALHLQLDAGARTPVTLDLTRSGRRLLARKGALPLTVKLKATTPGGVTRTKTLRLTLLTARR